MKTCRTCGESKSLDEFYRAAGCKSDGRYGTCKKCVTVKLRAPEARASRAAATRRFNKTAKGKANDERSRRRYPERSTARSAVNYLVRSGKLPPPKTQTCECGEPAIQYHHYKGYDFKRRLDVVAVCMECHAKKDTECLLQLK